VREDGRIVGGEWWQEKSTYQSGMEETPANIKESSHSAHANGMNECENALKQSSTKSTVYRSFGYCTLIM